MRNHYLCGQIQIRSKVGISCYFGFGFWFDFLLPTPKLVLVRGFDFFSLCLSLLLQHK